MSAQNQKLLKVMDRSYIEILQQSMSKVSQITQFWPPKVKKTRWFYNIIRFTITANQLNINTNKTRIININLNDNSNTKVFLLKNFETSSISQTQIMEYLGINFQN